MAEELDSIQSLLRQAHSDAPGLQALSPEEEAARKEQEEEKFRAAVAKFKADVLADKAIGRRIRKFRREGFYAIRPWQWAAMAILIPAILAGTIWGVNRASNATRANLALNRGLNAVYAGDAIGGLEEMRVALSLGARPAETLINFARALQDIGDQEGAMNLFDRAIAAAADEQDLGLIAAGAVGAGNIHLANGKLEEAERRAQAVLALDARQRDGLILHGRVLLAHGRFEEAAEAFVNSIERNPNSLMPRWYLRETYLRWGRVQAARDQEDYLMLARPSGDENIETLTGYADLLVRQNRLAEAEKVLLDVLSRQRQPSPNILVSLGYLAVENVEYERARDFAQQAIEVAPQSAAGYILSSEIHYFNGEGREALEDIHKALDLEPNSAKANYNMGCIMLFDLNMIPQALDHFRKSVANGFDGPFLHYNIGICRYLLRDASGALQSYALVPPAIAATADARWALANAHLAANEPDTAMALYKGLGDARERDPALANNIGVALELAGDSMAAVQQYWAALKIARDPSNADSVAQANIQRQIMGVRLTDPWEAMHRGVPLRVRGVHVPGRARRTL